MKPTTTTLLYLAILQTFSPAAAQTSTLCNPLKGTCPADPALGKSLTIDFTQGASDQFTGSTSSVDSNGAAFTVAKPGDSPTLTSKWYMMFGQVSVVMKAAPGIGIVSTIVLQSDDLDEIDWEWLGGDNGQVQSNYFGKGQTLTYNRGAFHPNPGNHDGFHKYTIEWTANQILWQIDGTTVRALSYASAEPGQYPQTPMQLKLGIWSGGDSSQPAGTVAWAGGATNYGSGPFTMIVKSVTATDYSTGTQYSYGDTSGTWQSIKSSGGQVNSGGNGNVAVAAPAPAPAVTAVSNGAPLPFDGTHRDTSSTFVTPSIYPWVANPTTLATSVQTSYPDLPSGWTVTPSGKIIPPSAAPSTSPPSLSPSSPPPSPSPSPSPSPTPISPNDPNPNPNAALIPVTTYNQQGFPTVLYLPPSWSTEARRFDNQGFLITPAAAAAATPAAAAVGTPAVAVSVGADTVKRAADMLPSSSLSLGLVASGSGSGVRASASATPTSGAESFVRGTGMRRALVGVFYGAILALAGMGMGVWFV